MAAHRLACVRRASGRVIPALVGQPVTFDVRPAVESQAALDRDRIQAMSYNISTLLTRNLHDVFGENDPARRRAAIDEIFTEDCVF